MKRNPFHFWLASAAANAFFPDRGPPTPGEEEAPAALTPPEPRGAGVRGRARPR